jgi:hypothetical protein
VPSEDIITLIFWNPDAENFFGFMLKEYLLL